MSYKIKTYKDFKWKQNLNLVDLVLRYYKKGDRIILKTSSNCSGDEITELFEYQGIILQTKRKGANVVILTEKGPKVLSTENGYPKSSEVINMSHEVPQMINKYDPYNPQNNKQVHMFPINFPLDSLTTNTHEVYIKQRAEDIKEEKKKAAKKRKQDRDIRRALDYTNFLLNKHLELGKIYTLRCQSGFTFAEYDIPFVFLGTEKPDYQKEVNVLTAKKPFVLDNTIARLTIHDDQTDEFLLRVKPIELQRINEAKKWIKRGRK
jgi:hypothetical protein